MTDPFSTLFSALPGMEEVRRWEEECARIDGVMADLATKREQYRKMIQSAKDLLDPQGHDARKPATASDSVVAEAPAPALPKKKRNRREHTWRSAIAVIVKANPEGIAYDKIKEQVPAHLKEQLIQFPEAKGFYAALSKLDKEGVIVRQNSMAFTKRGYAKYKAKVDSGEIVKMNPRRESPMADVIKQFLRDQGSSKGAAIRAHLIQFPEFAGPVLKNNSAMYNVLLRLKERGEILHDEEAATYSIAQENGASAFADAPEAGRGATLPFENVVDIRQPR